MMKTKSLQLAVGSWQRAACVLVLVFLALGCQAQTNYRALMFNTNTGTFATPWSRLLTNYNVGQFETNAQGQLSIKSSALTSITNVVLDGLTGGLSGQVLTLTNAAVTNLPSLVVAGETTLSNNLFGVDAVFTGTMTAPSFYGTLFGKVDRSSVGTPSGGAPYGGAQSDWRHTIFGAEAFRLARHSSNANVTRIYIPDRDKAFLLFKEDSTNNFLWAVWQGATPTNNTFTGAPWTLHVAGSNLFLNITGTNWVRFPVGQEAWTD
jgi:hypothetical protein